MPSKPLKLGIACLKLSNEEIRDFYKNRGIEVFVLEEKEAKMGAINPVCGVCGKLMRKDKTNNWICKTCEYFFGMSSKPTKCERCGHIYGTYPGVRFKVTNGRCRWDIECYKCREEIAKKTYAIVEKNITIADLIKGEMEKRNWTKHDLIDRGIPEEFIEFCLGRKEINL